ncbi:hypothetical protein ESCO_001821 [Escovopsis weberi]|uniref:Uncharacterized protein n=1 Tax=Escovopsis weberi TaxID=150374 RepID=A0A0M9VWA3_ESCWE|nr:hypothetical protein ESCO_001821 [Escovopsis weberi]
MKGSFVVGALAAGMANAWSYPDCEPDNCYRNAIDQRFSALAPAACFQWLAGTTTADSAVPTDFNNCNAQEFSSACSCHRCHWYHHERGSSSGLYHVLCSRQLWPRMHSREQLLPPRKLWSLLHSQHHRSRASCFHGPRASGYHHVLCSWELRSGLHP